MMRTLVVGDIHGCLTALKKLLELADLQPGDRLITLGDMIDRGQDSRGVLELLMDLHRREVLTPLRGNHEMMFLEAAQNSSRTWLDTAGGRATLMSFGVEPSRTWRNAIPIEVWRFINETCLDLVELDNHFMVHANVEAGLSLEDQPPSVIHWAKLEPPLMPHISGKTMVCGHTIMGEGLPVDFGSAWCLDTGAYQDFGWLSMVDLETRKVWQANERGESRQVDLQPWTPASAE
jgi:serine/threonine protein phosphatase 1